MNAEQDLKNLSNAALRGAIDCLESAGMWGPRLVALRKELRRRKAAGRKAMR